MSAGKENLTVDQGTDWYINFTYKDSTGTPINLTGYTAALQFRSNIIDAIPALSLASGSGITITASTGLIAVHATAAQTGAISAGYYYYDLEITSASNIVTRLIEGRIQLVAQVTR
jgi:hypothetical protein